MKSSNKQCQYCGGRIYIGSVKKVVTLLNDGIVSSDRVYSERCVCGNLLYAQITPE